jgi:hypothetical protein
MNYVTIIPSKDRLNLHTQYKDLPIHRFKEPIFNTKLWVPSKERTGYNTLIKDLGYNVEIVSDPISTNIAETRESIIEYCAINNYERVLMIDDDIRFFARVLNFQALPLETSYNKKMMEHLGSICSEKYPLVSLKERFMIQQSKYGFEKNAKIIRLYMIHVPTFIKNNISFLYKDIKVFEDKLIQVLLNKKGFRTISTTYYAQNTRDSSNNNGGCSSYRTNKETERCVQIFLRDFPEAFSPTMKYGYADGPVVYVKSTLKKYLDKTELPYVPFEEMEEHIKRINFKLKEK